MNLYQINAEIEQLENAVEDGMLIDEETGELLTFEQALDQLHMMKTEKVENIALLLEIWTLRALRSAPKRNALPSAGRRQKRNLSA